MAVGRGGNSVKTKLGFLLYGEQGTRKSSFCLEFLKMKNEDGSPFKVLYIDPEQGSIDTYLDDYEEAGYDTRNLYLLYTQSLSEVSEYIQRAKNGEDFYYFDDKGEETDEVYKDADGKPFRPDAIVVDGVTVLYLARQQGILDFSKKRATVRAKKNEVTGMAKEVAIEGASLEKKDYGTLKFDGQSLILDLIGSGKNFAVTCREEDEKEAFKDKEGNIKTMATGRKQPSGFKDIRYNVKTVIHLFKDDDGVIKGIIENKDRTKVHEQDELLIEPSMVDWQVCLDKNKNKKDYIIDNNLKRAVEIERKSIEKDNARFEEAYEDAKEEVIAVELKTPEDYHAKITEQVKKLKGIAKDKKLAEIKEAGLPRVFQKINDMEVLKKYLDILEK